MHNKHWLTLTRFSPVQRTVDELNYKGDMYPSPCSRYAACSKLVRGLEIGTRLQTALRGPAHQLAVHMRIIISIMVRGPIQYGMVRGALPLGSSSLLLRCIILLHRGFWTSVPFIKTRD